MLENELSSELSKLTGLEFTDESKFKSQLSTFINDLINKDFSLVVNLLYRIDVSEEKLRNTLKENDSVDASEIISDLIIERQKIKIATRNSMKGRTDETNEERW